MPRWQLGCSGSVLMEAKNCSVPFLSTDPKYKFLVLVSLPSFPSSCVAFLGEAQGHTNTFTLTVKFSEDFAE